ncbi:MAG: hypothetical protein J6L23_02370 [Clostridia bacterium]|nr:hypothetical protein [Clostridia bacterium]MBQ6906371.1 hypothetical protein [Clostridia bacterium]
MDIQGYKEQLEEIVASMSDYLDDAGEDAGFTTEDIEDCENLILRYLSELEMIVSPTNELIMEKVKELVLALNDLNEGADHCLLETDEREAICELIQCSAEECGLIDPESDVTEEWREW